jgi:hypothetical protein
MQRDGSLVPVLGEDAGRDRAGTHDPHYKSLTSTNHRPEWKAFAMLAYRECGMTMQMIAKRLGMHQILGSYD